jgi:hypothetical protein
MQTYKQRLARKVHAAVSSPEHGVTFPYDFAAYAKCAASCMGKKLNHWSWTTDIPEWPTHWDCGSWEVWDGKS